MSWMGKNDYEEMADILNEALRAAFSADAKRSVEWTSRRLGDWLERENPEFNRQRFLAACGL